MSHTCECCIAFAYICTYIIIATCNTKELQITVIDLDILISHSTHVAS